MARWIRLVAPLAWTVAITAAAAGLAAWMFHDLGVERVAGVLLAAVFVTAALWGVIPGLLSAALGAVAFNMLIGAAALEHQLQSPVDVLLLAALIAGSCVAGVLSDLSRRAPPQERERSPEPPQATPVEPAPVIAGGRGLNTDTRRLVATVALLGVAVLAALVIRPGLDGGSPALAFAAVVAALGVLHGARVGAVSGVVATIALNILVGPHHGGWLSELIDFAIIVGLGWGIGRVSDQVSRERAILRAMTAATRQFSSASDEATVWTALLETMVTLSPGASVRLVDETGATLHERLSPGRGAWRTRQVTSDGRPFGVVYWAPRDSLLEGDGQDELMASIVDLAASGVARTRLGVEKAEMEFIARTEQLRTILLDAVSHHFRTPLAGIIGSVTSVLSLPEPHDRAARRDLLLIIKEQANRLHRYVENFLSVARLESGAIEMKLQEVVVEPLLYDVWESFGEAGGARRFLHVKVDDDSVRADPDLLSQVFGNVLENAIKFSAEGSVVDIRSRRVGDKLVFDVTDQGCGVPPAAEARIFERFVRGRGAVAPGLGLGLYITRSLVEMQGGEVEAHNRDDGAQGLVVSIALPLAEAA
ncbi:ATP-binding protein [Phenylobacterium sp.]|uniref:sensor histidine kinase n=1 Tax=Phenylobacterium sp. TaxID=1871053 RepID=UPI0035B06282